MTRQMCIKTVQRTNQLNTLHHTVAKQSCDHTFTQCMAVVCFRRKDVIVSQSVSKTWIYIRDVTDSSSASESDGIWHFFRNPKSDGYMKSNRVGFEIANC